MVECVQNVFHHQLKPEHEGQPFESGIIVSNDENSNYRIVSGNYIVNTSTKALGEKISFVHFIRNRYRLPNCQRKAERD